MNSHLDAELKSILSPPPELTEEWWGHMESSKSFRVRQLKAPALAHGTNDSLIVRKAGSDEWSGQTGRADKENTNAGAGLETAGGRYMRIDCCDEDRNDHFGSEHSRQWSDERRIPDRVMRTEKTSRSDGAGPIGASKRSPEACGDQIGNEGGQTRYTKYGSEHMDHELTRAWGLKDPRVARALVRRMRRMRRFKTGEVS